MLESHANCEEHVMPGGSRTRSLARKRRQGVLVLWLGMVQKTVLATFMGHPRLCLKSTSALFFTYFGNGPARAESAGSRTFPTLSSNEEGIHTSVNISWSNRKSRKNVSKAGPNKTGFEWGNHGFIRQTPKHQKSDFWVSQNQSINNQSVFQWCFNYLQLLIARSQISGMI